MKFSLILPTRKRVNLVLAMLNSIAMTTKNLSEIETFVIHDNDDLETKKALLECQRQYEWLLIFNRERGTNLSRDYFNWAVPFTRGNYLWALNDDAEIETYRWDEIILDKMKDHEIGLGNVACPHYDHPEQISPFSYFPLLTRKTVEKLGYLMPEQCPGWCADARMCQIFNMAGKH